MNKPMASPRAVHAGWAHVWPIRVYYEDTDAAGIVYYANYLRFAERARTEMLREISPRYYDPATAGGIAFAVRRCTADFARAARLDDVLQVHTRIVKVAGASFNVEQIVRRGAEALVRLDVHLACMNAAGRAERLPLELRAVLRELCTTSERSG